MIAEILSIGTELLMGQITNTDAQFIAKELSELGVTLYRQTTVGDNPQRVREAMETALQRSDIVITSGGLGPTEDDLTKEMVAQVLGVPMVQDADSVYHVTTWMRKVGRELTENNMRQTYFPQGSIIMPNRCGSAPGCIAETADGKAVAVLPGPPRELQDMFTQQLKPYLRKKSGRQITSRFLHIFGVGESKVETILSDLFHNDNPTLALYCGAGQVYARITASTAEGEDASALLEPVEKEIYARLGDSVYGEGLEWDLPRTVIALLREKGEKLAIAETHTGGMLASRIVDVPGASAVFGEGYTLYSDESKVRLGAVSSETLSRYGAVSSASAKEMAMYALRTSGADWALAVTGIAGPDGGTEEKPVGTTYVGIAHGGTAIAFKFAFRGDRAWIRTLSCENAFNALRLTMLGKYVFDEESTCATAYFS